MHYSLKDFFGLQFAILATLFSFGQSYAQCDVHGLNMRDINNTTVAFTLLKSPGTSGPVSYEYGTSGFTPGTGTFGNVNFFGPPSAQLTLEELASNQSYDLYICGELVHTFTTVMSLDIFEDNFEGENGMHSSWRTVVPVSDFFPNPFPYAYSKVFLDSGALGNQGNYMVLKSTAGTWTESLNQDVKVISPEIPAMKKGETIRVTFDAAAVLPNGFETAPVLKLYARSSGALNYFDASPEVDSKWIADIDMSVTDFTNFSVEIPADSAYSCFFFSMSEVYNDGAIYIDNVSVERLDESLDIEDGKEGIIMEIAPNPVNDMLNIQCDLLDRGNIRILDVHGRSLILESYIGTNHVDLDLTELPSGMYMIELTNAKNRIVKQFVKR